jgi:hypothetical protein
MASKLFMRRAIVAALIVTALAASKTASAQTPEQQATEQCMSQLADCFYTAANNQGGFWSIWAGGLECEVRWIECFRRNLVGH